MKTFILLAFSASAVLACVATAEDQDQTKEKPKQPKVHTQVAPPARRVVPAQPAPRAPQFERRPDPSDPGAQNTARLPKRPAMPDTTASHPIGNPEVDPATRERYRNWQNQTHRNTPANNPNWQNHNQTPDHSWDEARRRHRHESHDRYWWRSHYTRFALFGSGYFFWDGGYWYPAYGYDPSYDTYEYNEPIYGYNDLEPSQVIANVQSELQRLGYYRFAVDGEMGPLTRAAIADYQRDNSLAITSAIDLPTLESLGLR